MPYRIGEAFSDNVWNSLERERDRRARGSGSSVRRTRKEDTGLQEAMLRNEGENARAQQALGLKRELGLLDVDTDRQRLSQRAGLDMAELDRKSAADASLHEYRQGGLDIRAGAEEARAGRYADRATYEDRVAGVREGELAISAAKLESQREAAALRAGAEGVKTTRGALALIARVQDMMLRPNKDGQMDQGRMAAILPTLRAIQATLQEKGLPPGEIEAAVQKAIKNTTRAAGMATIDEEEEADPLLDLALDEDTGFDTPPRFGT